MASKADVYVLSLFADIAPDDDTLVVSTVSKHTPDLSPFKLGPCELYDGHVSRNMENAWQYSKVYSIHHSTNRAGPNRVYWEWAKEGWNDRRAQRYPMGKGARPLYSYWDGYCLDYVSARKVIYGPLYAEQVIKTKTYEGLKRSMKKFGRIILLDYDAYDHHRMSMSLTDVLNNPKKKMGHAFVLAMLLTRDKALKQMELRDGQ